MPRKMHADCRACGVCCVAPHDQESFCDLVESDLVRLPPKLVKKNVVFTKPFDFLASGCRTPPAAFKTVWVGQRSGPLKGFELCACIFLRGTLLVHTRCSIYSRRPEVCREAVKPGDRVCTEMRKVYSEYTKRWR